MTLYWEKERELTFMQKVIAYQHTKNEPLGYLEDLLTGWDVPYEYIPLWETNEVLQKDASHMVFLGGPMSVNDEEIYPYLVQEKDLIRRSVKRNVPILGLCLGAQLIASAHGARVCRFVNETGWFPVTRVPDADTPFASFPDQFPVFQFHSETFALPVRGRLLCTGDQVRHQAFRYRSALALQFHLEMTEPLIVDWCRDIRRTQRDTILRDTKRYLAESNRLCRDLFRKFLGR